MTETKIPKVIHYCWFGGNPLPDLAKKCIDSWRKFCPDYEIKEWNESNFDLDSYPYAREAYNHKKFAFVTDVVRLHALYNYGGIYMDTDVELVKNLDSILQYSGVSGFESIEWIPTGLMASCKHHPLVKEWLDDYDETHFVKTDGTLDLTTNVIRITNICRKYGFVPNGKLQTIADFTFFPTEYFCPKNFLGNLNLTENSYSIHHFNASWVDTGIILIRKDKLDSWGFKLMQQEEQIYFNALQYKFSITNKNELETAANLMDRIFITGNKHYEHDNLRILIKLFLKQIAESGLKNNTTSLKLYFTTFKRWKIFETPRANLRYIYHCLRDFSDGKIDRLIFEFRKYYKKLRQFHLKNTDFSLIASNCNGAMILHDLNLKFNSPFVDLWIKPKDFIKICGNLKDYMNCNLSFTTEEGIDYPVGILKDIKIYFQHYKTDKEAEYKWNERKQRINYENLFILFTDRDGCTKQDLIDFDNLKYINKAVFVHKPFPDIKSAVYIKGFEQNDSVGMCMDYKGRFSLKRYYDDFDYVSWFNKGINK